MSSLVRNYITSFALMVTTWLLIHTLVENKSKCLGFFKNYKQFSSTLYKIIKIIVKYNSKGYLCIE